MRKSRFTEEPIVGNSKEAEGGRPVKAVIRNCVTACSVFLAVLLTVAIARAEDDYAESVNLIGHSNDAGTTLDVRLARFPAQGKATLWLYAFVDGHQYALVDEGLSLVTAEATDQSAPSAHYEATGPAQVRLGRQGGFSAGMKGRVIATASVSRTADPSPGPGEIPVSVEVSFRARHEPVRVSPGRVEVMGHVVGSIRIADRIVAIDMPGKWHEQHGSRPRFAPAFTYLVFQGPQNGIIATKAAGGAWGYAIEGQVASRVVGLAITPYGVQKRDFSAKLEDGRVISGTANVVREVNVPIEGKRRPGAAVTVESDLGGMVGILNDWTPP